MPHEGAWEGWIRGWILVPAAIFGGWETKEYDQAYGQTKQQSRQQPAPSGDRIRLRILLHPLNTEVYEKAKRRQSLERTCEQEDADNDEHDACRHGKVADEPGMFPH